MKIIGVSMKKSIRIQIILMLILSCLILSACDDGLRKAPYSKQDLEEYLEANYEADLVILPERKFTTVNSGHYRR